MQFNKQLPFLILILLVTAFSSCQKDRGIIPVITTPNGGKDTVTVGKITVLSPKMGNKSNASFSWTINGQAAGTDSVLNFNPATRGDYKINFKATGLAGEASVEYNIHVYGKYENGFYVVNEGWYGHGTGTVGFYRYDTKKMEDSIFTKENPGKDLMPASSTLQSGVIFGDKFYLILKVGGAMIVTDKYSLKEIARIPAKPGNDWRSFVGLDADKGLLSAQTGLYPINLNNLSVGTKLAGVNGQIGDLIKAGNYIFALSASQGVVIINASTNAVEKTIAGAIVGFTRTIDGAVWAAGGQKLFKINPVDLTVETINVSFPIYGSWAAWHPGSISASTKENAVFFARNATWYGGKEVYKYIPGNAASLQTPFITLPAGKELYGSGVAYNQKLDKVILNTVQSGFGQNYKYNNMYIHNANTGALNETYTYEGFYFPSILVAP